MDLLANSSSCLFIDSNIKSKLFSIRSINPSEMILDPRD